MKSTHFHCCSKSYWGYWPYWLTSQWAQYLWRGIWTTISSCWFLLRNPILLCLNLIYQCTEMNRWVFLHQKMCNFQNVSFFIKVSDEEKILLFQHDEINGKSVMLSYWYMLDARMRIRDHISPNWAIEVCKWSVTITICSFPYIGKSKELDHVRKSAHEVMSGSNHPP